MAPKIFGIVKEFLADKEYNRWESMTKILKQNVGISIAAVVKWFSESPLSLHEWLEKQP